MIWLIVILQIIYKSSFRLRLLLVNNVLLQYIVHVRCYWLYVLIIIIIIELGGRIVWIELSKRVTLWFTLLKSILLLGIIIECWDPWCLRFLLLLCNIWYALDLSWCHYSTIVDIIVANRDNCWLYWSIIRRNQGLDKRLLGVSWSSKSVRSPRRSSTDSWDVWVYLLQIIIVDISSSNLWSHCWNWSKLVIHWYLWSIIVCYLRLALESAWTSSSYCRNRRYLINNWSLLDSSVCNLRPIDWIISSLPYHWRNITITRTSSKCPWISTSNGWNVWCFIVQLAVLLIQRWWHISLNWLIKVTSWLNQSAWRLRLYRVLGLQGVVVVYWWSDNRLLLLLFNLTAIDIRVISKTILFRKRKRLLIRWCFLCG